MQKLDMNNPLAYEFSVAAGNYLQQLYMLGNSAKTKEEKAKYHLIASHDGPQCFTWLVQILQGHQVKAWAAEDAKELIKKLNEKTALLSTLRVLNIANK